MPAQAPDAWFSFGYAQSMAVHAVLEEALRAGDLSRRGIQAAGSAVGTVDFGGLLGDYDYGSGASDREPPRASTIFAIDPAVPGGLAVVEAGIASPAAQELPFDRG